MELGIEGKKLKCGIMQICFCLLMATEKQNFQPQMAFKSNWYRDLSRSNLQGRTAPSHLWGAFLPLHSSPFWKQGVCFDFMAPLPFFNIETNIHMELAQKK